MGVVYLAKDPHLHRQVAVKTYSLPEGVSEDVAKQFHERFLREARAAASLSHPGIVTIYDAGEDPARGIPYIAMEFVPGQSLKQRLESEKRLDSAWILAFGAVLADALHLAHRAGIVHRDIKPANILIREGDGAAKIADFGVARLKSSELTQSGAYLGSPGYMSPEQIRGGALDGRSDLFSLAVVLYESFCGKRPFHGDDLVALAYSIAHDTQVPLARQLQGCPPGLDRFFDRALSKDPDKRFPDGATFRQAFLDAGSHGTLDRSDQTVLDVGAEPDAATQPLRTVLDAGTVAVSPSTARGGRGRSFGLTLAAAALLTVGVAAASYHFIGGRLHPGWAVGHPPVPRPAAAVETPQAHPEEPTSSHELTARDGGTVQKEVTGRQSASAPSKSVALTDVGPAEGPRLKPRNLHITVPAGAEIHLTLDTAVASSSSRPGDTITASITDPVVVGDRVAIPARSRVHGRVSEAVPAKKGLGDKAGSLSLSFDRVVTPFGFGAPMSAALSRSGSKSGKKTAGIIGGSAAGGVLLGKIRGGDSKKSALGALVGGALGTGIAANTKGEDVELTAGTSLAIRLDKPLTISVTP
jgi:protein kinase-like protein